MEGGFSGVIYFLLNCMYCKVCFGRIMYKKYIYNGFFLQCKRSRCDTVRIRAWIRFNCALRMLTVTSLLCVRACMCVFTD